ncbi:MAG TPA: histidinol dehydrogenase [Bacteroidetes bacterium]|nr:histidinol dehydrogenase [Bacteroidota bacterium]
MQMVKYPDPESLGRLLQRPLMDFSTLESAVGEVLLRVKEKGEEAVKEYTLQFDGFFPENLEVSAPDIERAARQIPGELKQAIQRAATNIRNFHEAQWPESPVMETAPGVECSIRYLPMEKVGLYIPGGTAPLFSTVLMLAVPACVAGCREIVMCTPPDKNGHVHPVILYAALYAGVQRIFRCGGAQAVAAMAYGAGTVPKVDKIFGPGNQYVTMAKQLVNREGVAIDMPAGPSEVLVVADATADPEFVAADLLSQAEHGPDSQVLLVTTEEQIIEPVLKETEKQLKDLPRKEIASAALENSRVFLLRDWDEVMQLVNRYAPEHLILQTTRPEELAEKVENAGSVFLGPYTPESAGDYASGTNHTLPTNGFARAWSGVNLLSFMKSVTFQKISREGLLGLGPVIEVMAEAERLEAHRNAVTIRLNKIKRS